MPIRKLEIYSDDCANSSLPIAELESKSLAIDGFWYIKKYLKLYSESHLLNHLSVLNNFLDPILKLSKKTQILWVWDGLEFSSVRSPELNDYYFQKVFDATTNGRFNSVNNRKYCKLIFDQEFFVEEITRILKSNGISVVRAPYLASAQCVYLLKTKVVNYVFSKNDALLFADCDFLISEFHFSDSKFDVIDREVLFKKNYFDLEIFRRISFLSGCEFCQTVPSLVKEFDSLVVLDIVFNKDLNEYFNIPENKKFKEEFLNAFNIVEYSLVMLSSGEVSSIGEGDLVPCDLSTIFGKRLADSLYIKIYNCNIGVKFLSNIIFPKREVMKQFDIHYKSRIFACFLKLFGSIYDDNFNKRKFLIFEKNIPEALGKFLPFNSSPDLNFICQATFVGCNDVDQSLLVKFLNSGTSKKVDHQLCDNDLVKINTRYTVEDFAGFYRFSEAVIYIKELIGFLKCELNADCNIEPFSFTYDKFINPIDKTIMASFIEMNSNLPKIKDMALD